MKSLDVDHGIVSRHLWLTNRERRPWPQWLQEVDITLYFILLLLIAINLFVMVVR